VLDRESIVSYISYPDSLYRLLLIVVEDDLSEKTTGSVIHMNNDILESTNSLERSLDKI
jgi:hypothetical protein